ncbi:hypothetical protein Tco_0002519 [Tanacetum coccineum]
MLEVISTSPSSIVLAVVFKGTATARTTDDGEVEITASINGQVKSFIEASLRRHLKLEDSDGITSLSNTKIFEQLTLMGYVSDSAKLTFQKGHFSPQWRITSSPSLSPQTYQSHQSSPLRDITRQDYEIPQSQFPTQTQVADEATFKSVDADAGVAATTDIVLKAGQDSGTMHKTPTRPHDSPFLRFYKLGSDEGSLQQNELMDLVTKLTDRVEVLENDLQQTKKVYSSALTKFILRGRKISEIDKDHTISLVHPEQDMEYDFDVSTAKGFTTTSVPVTTASASISTVSPLRVSSAEDISGAKTQVYIKRRAEKRKDKGKAIMKEDESVQKNAKKQLEQERLRHKEAIRLQEQINEEEKQRIARDAEIAKQLQEEFDRARQE